MLGVLSTPAFAQTAASDVSYVDSAFPSYDGTNVQDALDGSKTLVGALQQSICILTPIRFYAYSSTLGENDVAFDASLPNNHYEVLFTQIGDGTSTPTLPILMTKTGDGFAFYDPVGSNVFDIMVSTDRTDC